MTKNDRESIEIPISDVYATKPDISTHKNLVVVQVQNEVLKKGKSNSNHLIDVYAQVSTNGMDEESVDIKDVIMDEGEKEVILHYIIYDLCNLDHNSKIKIQIHALDGEFSGFVNAEIIDLEPFSIQCIDKKSEVFRPREQHGACETWDGSIWVYGGKRNVDKEEQVLGDIMTYDSKHKMWKTVHPSSTTEPAPRFGHNMM